MVVVTQLADKRRISISGGTITMRAQTLIRILTIGSWIGFVLVVAGFYVALFTDVTTKYGLPALRDDAELIALGLLLLVPSKTLMTFKLMRVKSDDKSGAQKEQV
jgi:hypothetical protein